MSTTFVPFTDVTLTDGFWKRRYETNARVSVPNIEKRFEETGRFDAIRFNHHIKGGQLHFFYDSDAAKYIEALAYLIRKDREGYREAEARVDAMIDEMEKNQRPDGYINSYHQQLEFDNVYKVRSHHELYCLGHMIEAAVAYHEATGKRKLLDICERACAHVDKVFFSPDTPPPFRTPGHEEIELALYRLWRHTGKERYREMADGFLTRRGREPDQNAWHEYDNLFYGQDNAPLEELQEIDGHCVRALYYLSGAADSALVTDRPGWREALDRLFDSMVDTKMYVTGGVGSTYRTESFTVPYDLPNRTAYSESCCAVAQILFATRMRLLSKKAKYGHLIERVMYNSLLSSTSIDGKGFFYVNPLELALESFGRETSTPRRMRERMPIKTRVEVFGCSCCPPNIARCIATIGGILCVAEDGGLCVEQYVPAELDTAFGHLTLSGDYANTGKFRVSSADYRGKTLSLRVPAWCETLDACLDGKPVALDCRDGYAELAVSGAFELTLDFHIAPRFIAAHPLVRADAGRVALTYGPLVYCLEGVENGAHLNLVSVPADDVAVTVGEVGFHGFRTLTVPGFREDAADGALYGPVRRIRRTPVTLTYIPYFAFANRGESDMLVWVRRA